jgi:DNA primase small subunit
MNSKSISFVQRMFRNYYKREYSSKSSLLMIDRHEFGFALFEGWMLRHKSFKSIDKLKQFLQNSVPSNAYCSCAYYEDPEADMDKKGWLGADLVFDIDADHIPTPCDKVHDNWVCGVCGLTGKGFTPSKCPVCGGEKFEVSTWPCEVCLNSAKKESVKLLDMLMRDFGFSKNSIRVFFSGHRGYHVHVESEVMRTLDGIARKEIVDCVTGLGLDVFFYGLSKKSLRETHASQASPLSELGWRKRIALGMQNFILNAKEEDLGKIGLKKNIVETILQNRDIILKNLNKGTWGVVRGIGFETWRKIAQHSAKLQSAKIDTVVTTDIHRLIRLANTLHSKTGLKKVEFPVSTIDDFDPFKKAVVFKTGAVTVLVSDAPEFRLGDEVFGPYKQQKVELPTAAAMLLVCKGRAEVIE